MTIVADHRASDATRDRSNQNRWYVCAHALTSSAAHLLNDRRLTTCVWCGYHAQNPDPTNVLGVFGMSQDTTKEGIDREFKKYGTVTDIQIIPDRNTQRSRGFGFVYYQTVDEATTARKALDGSILDGRKIRVDFSVRHVFTPCSFHVRFMFA